MPESKGLTPRELALADQVLQDSKMILDALVAVAAVHRDEECSSDLPALCCGVDVSDVIKQATTEEDLRETKRLLMLAIARLADVKRGVASNR